MKTKLIASIVVILITFIRCNEDVDPIIPYPNVLTLLDVIESGCFSKQKLATFDTDTLFCTLENDSLQLTINMVNNCAARLVDSISVIDNNHVSIYIKNNSLALANCICTFEYQYFFNYIENNEVQFLVFLQDFDAEDYTLWGEVQYP